LLQPGELPGKTALRRRVDDQDRLAAIGRQRNAPALGPVEAEGIGIAFSLRGERRSGRCEGEQGEDLAAMEAHGASSAIMPGYRRHSLLAK
jgi:hypothetical protein